MFTMMKKFDNFISFVREKCSKYVYTFFMPLFASFIVLLFWVANWQLVGLTIMVLLTCFVLVFYDDFLPLVPLMLMLPMCFRNTNTAFSEDLAYCIIMFSLIGLAIVFHLIKYPIKKVKLDGFFYFLIALNIVFLISGIFSNNAQNYFKALDIYLLSGVMPIIIHFFFYNKVKLDNKVNHRWYVCVAFIIAITLSCVQLCHAKFTDFLYGNATWYPRIPGFCWANTNHIGNIILLAVPLCCYLMLASKHVWAWIVEILFLYACMFLSGSDGGLATLIIGTPFLMFFVYKNCFRDNFKFIKNIFLALIAIVVVALAVLVLLDLDELLTFITESSSGNGRIWAYEMSIDSFLEHPIFGIGLGGGRAELDAIVHEHDYNGFYHSTIFHIMACSGTVGIITYVVYYFVRAKYVLKNNTVLGELVFYAFIMFGVYGTIENSEFNIVLLFMTTLITLVGHINKNGSDDKPLPLFVKIPKFN